MSVKTKMKAIADKIRGLLGISVTMGLDDMNQHLGTVENYVYDETVMLDYAISAIQEKAAGGSGSGVYLPALDDAVRGTANDLAAGKRLYNDYGIAVDGALVMYGTELVADEPTAEWDDSGNKLVLSSFFEDRGIVAENTTVSLSCPKSMLDSLIPGAGGSGGSDTSGPYSYAKEFEWTAPSDYDEDNSVTIYHGLGVAPDGFYIVAEETGTSEDGSIVSVVCFDHSMIYANIPDYRYCAIFGTSKAGLACGCCVLTMPDEDITPLTIRFGVSTFAGDSLIIPAGKKYRVLIYKR